MQIPGLGAQLQNSLHTATQTAVANFVSGQLSNLPIGEAVIAHVIQQLPDGALLSARGVQLQVPNLERAEVGREFSLRVVGKEPQLLVQVTPRASTSSQTSDTNLPAFQPGEFITATVVQELPGQQLRLDIQGQIVDVARPPNLPVTPELQILVEQTQPQVVLRALTPNEVFTRTAQQLLRDGAADLRPSGETLQVLARTLASVLRAAPVGTTSTALENLQSLLRTLVPETPATAETVLQFLRDGGQNFEAKLAQTAAQTSAQKSPTGETSSGPTAESPRRAASPIFQRVSEAIANQLARLEPQNLANVVRSLAPFSSRIENFLAQLPPSSNTANPVSVGTAPVVASPQQLVQLVHDAILDAPQIAPEVLQLVQDEVPDAPAKIVDHVAKSDVTRLLPIVRNVVQGSPTAAAAAVQTLIANRLGDSSSTSTPVLTAAPSSNPNLPTAPAAAVAQAPSSDLSPIISRQPLASGQTPSALPSTTSSPVERIPQLPQPQLQQLARFVQQTAPELAAAIQNLLDAPPSPETVVATNRGTSTTAVAANAGNIRPGVVFPGVPALSPDLAVPLSAAPLLSTDLTTNAPLATVLQNAVATKPELAQRVAAFLNSETTAVHDEPVTAAKLPPAEARELRDALLIAFEDAPAATKSLVRSLAMIPGRPSLGAALLERLTDLPTSQLPSLLRTMVDAAPQATTALVQQLAELETNVAITANANHYEANVPSETTSPLKQLAAQDLKGALLQVLHDAQSPHASSLLRDLAGPIRDHLGNLETQQLQNVVAHLNDGAYQLQIPLFEPPSTATAFISLNSDDEQTSSMLAGENSPYHVFLSLDLVSLGALKIDAHVGDKTMWAIFYADQPDTVSLLRQAIPELTEAVRNLGFKEALFTAKPLALLKPEEREKFAAKAEAARSLSTRILDVKG